MPFSLVQDIYQARYAVFSLGPVADKFDWEINLHPDDWVAIVREAPDKKYLGANGPEFRDGQNYLLGHRVVVTTSIEPGEFALSPRSRA